MQTENHYGVWLHDERVGTLIQKGDHTRFVLAESYLDDVDRPVLGLVFEQDVHRRYAAALRLPCWFSNLLPEGRLREWIAADRQVSAQREMELLAQVGHDLPGAVRVHVVGASGSDDQGWPEQTSPPNTPEQPSRWRFSLAGVALKFSMLAVHDRLTLPATGLGGDWIVKLPDRLYPDVPRNEFAMMSLAGKVGINVPEVRLIHRDAVDGIPPGVWPDHEEWAYAVRRFDRTAERGSVHIEDLAQVRDVYPDEKYLGNYETVAALLYRNHDSHSLKQFALRLIFAMLISNGDLHLKNWSLIYRDPRIPEISPAYDLVSTRYYMGGDEELGMKFGGIRRFADVRLGTLDRLERRLGSSAGLADACREMVGHVATMWLDVTDELKGNPALLADVDASITSRTASLLAAGSR